MLLGHERKHEHKEVQHKLLLVHYFDWFWSFNLDGLYGWEGIGQSWEGVVSIYGWSSNGNSSLTNRIDKSILVNIFRETFEVKWTGTTWGGYKISPCWSERSCWES